MVQSRPMRTRAPANPSDVLALDREIFPEDPPVELGLRQGGRWWVTTHKGRPVAFAGARTMSHKLLLLERAGVVWGARGQGLHRRLIQVRMSWGRQMRRDAAITYTMADNTASANNLMDAGFRLYEPEWAWVGRDGVLYWWAWL